MKISWWVEYAKWNIPVDYHSTTLISPSSEGYFWTQSKLLLVGRNFFLLNSKLNLTRFFGWTFFKIIFFIKFFRHIFMFVKVDSDSPSLIIYHSNLNILFSSALHTRSFKHRKVQTPKWKFLLGELLLIRVAQRKQLNVFISLFVHFVGWIK